MESSLCFSPAWASKSEIPNQREINIEVYANLATDLGCSSSLQRLESTTNSIDAGVQEIKSFLKRADTGMALPPVASAPSTVDSSVRIGFSERCMKAAEISQRWTAIGIEDWIRAGRWWLLRVRT
jgi:hypothetical protein